jgi:glucokinase
MILAGDIGGTKTLLALFNGDQQSPVALESYASAEQPGLEAMVSAFLAQHPAEVEAAGFGVAGPVREGMHVDTTNLAWPVDGPSVARVLGLPTVGLLNDLEANAWGIAALSPDDFAVLNEGDPQAHGNAAVISAGTGLGEAGLYWDGERHHPFATEGGHADFAPRSDLEVELWRFLAAELHHVSYERVCSGMGIANIERFLRIRTAVPRPAWLEVEMVERDAAAAISRVALEERDEVCSQTLDLFVAIYGAVAGNLALKLMAVGGVYLGGGIAPKVLPRLTDGRFMEAFVDKGRFRELLERVSVRVILNERTALLGAARAAGRRVA